MKAGDTVPPEAAAEHLEGFVRAFVDPPRRERWLHFMTTKPSKAASELHRLPLNSRRATLVSPGDKEASELLTSLSGRIGACFTFKDAPTWKLVQDAAYDADWHGQDAVLSLEPGKLAIYFNHDHYAVILRGD